MDTLVEKNPLPSARSRVLLALARAEPRRRLRPAIASPPRAAPTAPLERRRALRHVQKLAHSLAPGQTGCLRGGTYRENVEVNANGAPGAPITIQSYPG